MVRAGHVMLEVIDKGSSSEYHSVPLLFVHGAEHAAWCWDEHFLNYFADRGYRAVAMSLRGHGGSTASKPSWAWSIADYVQDVRSVADRLPLPPVVIGHSLGGFVVQKYLESYAAPAAVLIASAPPQGAAGAILRNAKALLGNMTRHPGHMTGDVDDLQRVRSTFFSPATPETWVARYAQRLRKEPMGKFALDMLVLNLPKPSQVRTPVLVLGAQCDSCVTHTKYEPPRAPTAPEPRSSPTWATT